MLHTDTSSESELRLQTGRERELDQQLRQSIEREEQLQQSYDRLKDSHDQLLRRVIATEQHLAKLLTDKRDEVVQQSQQEQHRKTSTQRELPSDEYFALRDSRSQLLTSTEEYPSKLLTEKEDKLVQSTQLEGQLKTSTGCEKRRQIELRGFYGQYCQLKLQQVSKIERTMEDDRKECRNKLLRQLIEAQERSADGHASTKVNSGGRDLSLILTNFLVCQEDSRTCRFFTFYSASFDWSDVTVVGLTIVDDELLVLLHGVRDQVAVYSIADNYPSALSF